MFWLWVENHATGKTSLITFTRVDDRGFAVIALSAQPVTLRLQDC